MLKSARWFWRKDLNLLVFKFFFFVIHLNESPYRRVILSSIYTSTMYIIINTHNNNKNAHKHKGQLIRNCFLIFFQLYVCISVLCRFPFEKGVPCKNFLTAIFHRFIVNPTSFMLVRKARLLSSTPHLFPSNLNYFLIWCEACLIVNCSLIKFEWARTIGKF